MRLALLVLTLILPLGCNNSANEESLKLQRYEAATKELAINEEKLQQGESLLSLYKDKPEQQKQLADDIATLKEEVTRLKRVISENRP